MVGNPLRRTGAIVGLVSASLLTALPSSARAAIIIGPHVRNGSFESAGGSVAPWLAQAPLPPVGSHAVVADPAFATHGQNYLRVNADYAPLLVQRFDYDPAAGRPFRLEWDARVASVRPFE